MQLQEGRGLYRAEGEQGSARELGGRSKVTKRRTSRTEGMVNSGMGIFSIPRPRGRA